MKISMRKLLLAGYLILYAVSIILLAKEYFDNGYSFWEIFWITGTFGLPAVSILLYTLSYEPKHFTWFWKIVPFSLIAFNASVWYFHGPLPLNTQKPLPITISTGFIAAGLFFATFYLSSKFAYPQTATNRKAHLKVIIFSLAAALLCIASRYIQSPIDKVNIKINYVAEYNKITKPANYDPNENATPYYEKAFHLFVTEPNKIKSKEDLKAWPADLPEDKRVLLQTWITDNNEAVQQLKLGTEKPYYWVEHQGNFILEIAMPELAKARKLTYVLCSRAKLNASDGNVQQAFSGLATAYRLGIHFQGTKFMIEQLVGIAIDGLAVETAFQILNKSKAGPELLKQTQQQFEQLLAKQPFPVDFTSEKLLAYDALQRIFTDDNKGGGHICGTRFLEKSLYTRDFISPYWLEERKNDLKNLKRQQTVELTEKVYAFFNKIRQQTPYQLHKDANDPEEILKDMIRNDPLLSIFTPALMRVLDISHRCKIDTGALITTLALLRYKAEKNEYPATLEELLTAGYIKDVPIDPFSGKPLIYKCTADNFVLYSVGENFIDDGGIHRGWRTHEGDYVYWPVQATDKEKKN